MFEEDFVVKNHSKPFSSISQSRDRNEKIFCSLCANAGVESIVRDDICPFCGDIGIKHGITDNDELFVVNSVGGGAEGSTGTDGSRAHAFGSFGGLPSEKKTAPNNKRTLQQALKETDML
jgi:hypothetical protein